LEFTKSLISKLAVHSFCIVSGLALGIDRAAHEAALANNLFTIGVIASGIDLMYPPANADLFERVADAGAIVSEFPIGLPPKPFHFPRRNRIISGIADGLLLIEAPEKSGALITARAALEQGRDVFVVEWEKPTTATLGNQRLLDDGAIPVRSANDITREFALSQ
jgi:DNA processing protein